MRTIMVSSKSAVGGQKSMASREDGSCESSTIIGNLKKEWLLSDMQVKQFLREGYLVVEDVLTDDELETAIEGFRRTLWKMAGVDMNDLEGTGKHLSQLSSTNGSGGVLDIFYPAWKLQLQTNPKLFSIISQLWYAMYCRSSKYHLSDDDDDSTEQVYRCHPFLSEELNDEFCCTTGYVHIDRVGYRLPTKLAQQLGKSKKRPLQRSLTPHLDCCPDTFYDTSSNKKTMWRPIQCFVSFTDTEIANTGGLELVPKFHRNFHQWIHHRRPTASDTAGSSNNNNNLHNHKSLCFGEYTHLRPMEDREVMKQIQHIPVKAKSMVLWDYRLPHANSYRNDCNIPRSVVYCSFLPNIPINRAYVENVQLPNYISRNSPSSKSTTLWIKNSNSTNENHSLIKKNDIVNETPSSESQLGSTEEEDFQFSELGAKLMGIDRWS